MGALFVFKLVIGLFPQYYSPKITVFSILLISTYVENDIYSEKC